MVDLDELKRLADKLAKAHQASLNHLSRFHRYTAGTATSDKAWRSFCDATDQFDADIAALRAALEELN